MSYFQHFKLSLYFSGKLLIGSFKSLIHGIFPSFYIKSTTTLVKEIDNDLKNAGCKKNK